MKVKKMGAVTLDDINKNIIELRKEIECLKELVHEDFELADDAKNDILESRKRLKKEFISHEQMKKEFA